MAEETGCFINGDLGVCVGVELFTELYLFMTVPIFGSET